MDWRQEFLTDEYFRYSEECRRLARLSTNAQQATDRRRQATLAARASNWLSEFGTWLAPARHPAPLAVRFARSR